VIRFTLLLLAAVLTAAPVRAQEPFPDGEGGSHREDPDRLHRHWKASMGAEDYLRALDRTGMRAALEFPTAAAAGSWQEVGPEGGFGPNLRFNGRVAGIRIVSDGGGGYYVFAGASGGGLWRAHSSAPDVWTPLAQDLLDPSIRAFAIDPADLDHIVVCTGDPGRYKGAGVWVSWDGGNVWIPSTLPAVPEAFYRVDFRLGSSTILVAASELGILLSTDGGLSWEFRWQGPGNPWDHPATDLRIHPTNGLRMYAVAQGLGFLASVDGGLTWNAVPGSTGLPAASSWGRASLAISPDTPSTLAVLIGTTGDDLLGVWRSTDSGTSWVNVTGNLPDIGQTQMFHAQAITFEPGNTDHIWAASVNLARTADGGATWIRDNDPGATFQVGHSDVTQLLFSDLTGSGFLWICNDGGLYVHSIPLATTLGLNGSGATGLRISQIDQLEARRSLDVVGLQDNGDLSSDDTGATWTYVTTDPGGADGGGLAITDAEAVDFWCFWGVPWTLHRVLGGGTATYIPISATASPHYDPFGKKIYVPAGGTVYFTGAYDASPVWTAAAIPALHPDPSYGIRILSGSQADGKTLYASLRDNLKHDFAVARWTGSAWTVNTTLGLTPDDYHPVGAKQVDAEVTAVVPSGEWPGEAWVGFTAAVDSAKVVHTTDYGVTWEDVTGELAACRAVYALAPTPFDPRTIYAGTDIGIFRTTDGGQSWQPFQTGMPIVQCKDLEFVVDPGPSGNHRLVAATYGRGLWSRDIPGKPIVYVDKSNSGPEDGSIEHPYNTVAEAVTVAPAGAIVALRSNTYLEPQIVSKNLLLVTWAGTSVVK
jgi:photosystem II stability/assembly factor-like uncharacterized protein